MTATTVLWTAITLVAAGVAVRSRRPPIQNPLPTAIAVGGCLGLVTALVGLDWPVQAIVGAVTTLGLAGLLLRWRALLAEDHLSPGVGGNRLVGQIGTVVTAFDPQEQSGRVRLGADTWRATTVTDADLPKGTTVTVVAVEGVHLVVEPADRAVTASGDD